MKTTSIILRLIVLLAGLPVGLSSSFSAGVRDAASRTEPTHPSAINRGGLIQPLPTRTAPTHGLSEISTTNSATTNQTFTVKDGDFVGFDKLAGYSIKLTGELEYATNAPHADAQINAMIPAHLRAASGKTIRVNGYMTPLDYAGGKTTVFILSRSPSGCCFGDMPQIHEMIEVRMKTKPATVYSYLPVQVHGVLRVGAKRNGEALTCIYRLEAESVDEAAE